MTSPIGFASASAPEAKVRISTWDAADSIRLPVLRTVPPYATTQRVTRPPGAPANPRPKNMKITKSILIPASGGKKAFLRVDTIYAGPTGVALIQECAELVASDTFGISFLRHSPDGGQTWSELRPAYTPRKTSCGTERQGESALLLDGSRNRVIRFFNHSLYPGDTHTREVVGLTAIYFEVSTDAGRTFSKPQQLIIPGGTPDSPAPGITRGENCQMISFSVPFIDTAGRIILPMQRYHKAPEALSVYLIPLDAGCLIGECRADGSITWKTGGMACTDLKESSRGLCEPSISELRDGRFLMVCRGSNASLQSVPGRKWACLSEDGGTTWSNPEPFRYDNGDLFFSPATGSRLIRSTKNGKLYWIGNITPTNPNGNLPRYPLVIGEVDEESTRLIQSSVHTIDDREEDEDAKLQISNFRAFEDRVTGDFRVAAARLFFDSLETTATWEYRIAVT